MRYHQRKLRLECREELMHSETKEERAEWVSLLGALERRYSEATEA